MLARQAKVLSKAQVQTLLTYLGQTRAPARNRVIALLSIKAGLRAKEIAALRWSMVTDAGGDLCDTMRLPNSATKGNSGGAIPLAKDLQFALAEWRSISKTPECDHMVISTERSNSTSPQVIVNVFATWYSCLGFDGCSSHSGRRTFITSMARNISRYGGSLRDVQALARHSSLAMTQRYIEQNSEAMRQVVNS